MLGLLLGILLTLPFLALAVWLHLQEKQLLPRLRLERCLRNPFEASERLIHVSRTVVVMGEASLTYSVL